MLDRDFDLVDVTAWRVRDEEAAGGDEKEWLTDDDGRDWLFKPVTKHERQGFIQGEDWSEKVSAEMGTLLGVPCARVELAVRNGCRGSISLDLKPSKWELQHGAVLLAQTVSNYVSGDRQRRGHSLENIQQALEAASLLIERQLSYDQAMATHFQRLLRFFHGRAPLIWSVDDAHADYLDPSIFDQAR
jgi:hypothetical protein